MRVALLHAAIVAAAVAVQAAPAVAATTIYTSEADFAAATGAVRQTLDQPPAGHEVPLASYVQAGATFAPTTADFLFLLGAPNGFRYYNSAPYLTFQPGDKNTNGQVTTTATALGFTFGTYSRGAFSGYDPNNVTFSGTGFSRSMALPGAPTTSFFGVVSDAAIGTISFSTGNSTFDITSLSVAGGVPEPATWASMLLGMGLVGAGLRARRRAGCACG